MMINNIEVSGMRHYLTLHANVDVNNASGTGDASAIFDKGRISNLLGRIRKTSGRAKVS